MYLMGKVCLVEVQWADMTLSCPLAFLGLLRHLDRAVQKAVHLSICERVYGGELMPQETLLSPLLLVSPSSPQPSCLN